MTVNKNLVPDRLAGPRAVHSNCGRQLTPGLHDFCLKVLN